MIDVREAPAGREMDAAVAEALGWEPPVEPPPAIRNQSWVMRLVNEWGEPLSDDKLVWRNKDGDEIPADTFARYWSWVSSDGRVGELPEWSTDIADAWELAETMKEQGLDFAINRLDFFDWGWVASYAPASIMQHWDTVSADTAPLAICRAFLLANGVKEVNASTG